MYNWERNGWIKSSDNKPPENLDLIKEYYNLIQEGYRINLIKIKGHYGHKHALYGYRCGGFIIENPTER